MVVACVAESAAAVEPEEVASSGAGDMRSKERKNEGRGRGRVR